VCKSVDTNSFSFFIGHKAAAYRTGKEACKGFEKTSGQFSVYFCTFLKHLAHYSHYLCKSCRKHSKVEFISEHPHNRSIFLCLCCGLNLLMVVIFLNQFKFFKLVQGSKFTFDFGSTCATRCKFLGALPKF